MFPWKNLKKLPGDPREQLPWLYLVAAGVIEFLFITLESQFSYLPYYLAETWIILPTVLFVGHVLRGDLEPFAKRRLLLAAVTVTWFALSQMQHKMSGMESHPIGTVLFVYLMAFPFASAANDRNDWGMKGIGALFVAASMVLVGYSVLLVLDLVPAAMQEGIYWDGARLHVYWHSNISACFFMIGIGFAAAFLFQAKKPVTKALLLAAIIAQFLAMSLTNCRTTLLLTAALFGGIVFFWLFKNGGKLRFVLSLAAAVLVLVGTFKLSGKIFLWNNELLIPGASVEETMEAKLPENSAFVPVELSAEIPEAQPMLLSAAAETADGQLTQEQLEALEQEREEAIRILEEERDTFWNPALADELIAMLEEDPTILQDRFLMEDMIAYLQYGEDYYDGELTLQDIIAARSSDTDGYYQSADGQTVIQGDNVQGSLANDMRTLNGRTYIWSAARKAVQDNETLKKWGTEYVGTVLTYYNRFEVVHSHNSWVEAMMRMGMPGLWLSVVFTLLSVWSAAKLILKKETELWKKVIAMMTMCLLASGFLEPYLFITGVYYHVTDFAFFFCTGYLDYWCKRQPKQTA